MAAERSNNPAPTGPQAKSPEQPNDAGAFVAGVPAWWHPARKPAQVAETAADLLALLDPAPDAKDTPNGALLYGPPGTGKTSSACAVLYAWARAGHSARFQDFGELMVQIRAAWNSKLTGRTVEQIHAEIYKPRILLLDDVGKRAAPEDQEALSILVNGRINRGRPTILTTNCDLATAEGRAEFLAAADSRVLERYRRCDVRVAGANLRK